MKNAFLFCKEVYIVDKKHPNRSKGWHKVGNLSFKTSLLNKCRERADTWADEVLRRLSSSIDLVAIDAIYHAQCESNFFTKKQIPTTKGAETEHTPGHRTGNAMKSNFEKLCKWHDKETELFTVNELHAKMCSFTEKDLNVSFLKWMKKQLEQHYQNSIFFADDPGRSNVVCFSVMASTILLQR